MTVTVEVKKHGSLNLLRAMENLGLIHLQPSPLQNSMETVNEVQPPYYELRGIHKNLPCGSIDNFLARSQKDKEQEFEIEKRREEERSRLAKEKISS